MGLRFLVVLITFRLMAAELPISAVMVGHEYRQDDWPSVASAPDGSIWVAWLSFGGDRDDLAIRRFAAGKWSNLHWVPNSSGDSWLPQVGVDAANRVWVVWSQQVAGNWDLYARRFDPAKQEWGALERLTNDPLPDINPRMASDGRGRFAVAWQGFRGKNSNIFLKTFDGEKWSAGEVRVTNRAANDWEPAVALDSHGNAWVAYDSYRNGNYDVFVTEVRGGETQREMAVAATPRFEARATVAVDTADRVWVAWETSAPNWGKDTGYTIRSRQPGVYLGAARDVAVLCYEAGQWKSPAAPLAGAFAAGWTSQPHVFSDGRGSVWVAAKVQQAPKPGAETMLKTLKETYWDYEVTRFDGAGWREVAVLPHSRGRSSTRIGAAVGKDGALWLAWPTDNRSDRFYHRPLRGQIYAGSVTAPATVAQPRWGSGAEEKIEVKAGHADEAGDLRAIRGYTATIGGKAHHIVRGDFHRHTELSWDSGGRDDGSLQDFYRYMIDAAAMDFGANTDHQGGAWPYWWWYCQKMTDMYHVPGAYVPIFGYERSAYFPQGHRNVFFAKREESRITPFYVKEGMKGLAGFGLPPSPEGDEPGIAAWELAENDTKLLYEELRPRNGISIPHSSATKMGTDWRDNDPELEPVVEIFQGCRTNYERLGAPLVAREGTDDAHMKQAGYEPSGMVSNAWGKGYKLGIIASSDHYSTHISYAMVYTADPTRQGILDAIRKRHTYGAMDNIILDVRMGSHFMGDEFALAKAQPLKVEVRGTRAIAKVEVIKDSAVVYSTEPGQRRAQFEFVDKASVAGRHYYYVRVQQDDATLAWSSPMFVNYK